MPAWPAFGAAAFVVTGAFVLLARSSAATIKAALEARTDPDAPAHPAAPVLESDRLLLGNVVASHGLLLVVLAGIVWTTQVPVATLGVEWNPVRGIVLGTGLGLLLAFGNEVAARFAVAVGLDRDERLRELIAPNSRAGWLGLLVVVLPLVALAEELLFRAVLIGGLAAGFGLPPWPLAALSAVAFGIGHRLQGNAGVVVTTALGFVLGGAFVLTGSFLTVVIAHYLVNALEFLVNEGPA